jgi:hypothetical protein
LQYYFTALLSTQSWLRLNRRAMLAQSVSMARVRRIAWHTDELLSNPYKTARRCTTAQGVKGCIGNGISLNQPAIRACGKLAWHEVEPAGKSL